MHDVRGLSLGSTYRLADGRIIRVTGHNIPEGGILLAQEPVRYDYSAIGLIYDPPSGRWLEWPEEVPLCEIGEECQDPGRIDGT
jgi:hypothetical protein